MAVAGKLGEEVYKTSAQPSGKPDAADVGAKAQPGGGTVEADYEVVDVDKDKSKDR